MIEKLKTQKPPFKNFVILTLLIVLIAIIGNDLRKSLFFKSPDRVNIIVYGRYPVYYSLGFKDSTNYKIDYYSDLKIEIPGGYGLYRIGGINKLVSLEKNPEIFKKTFSLASFSFVDYYFYPKTDEIYYGGERENQASQIKPISLFYLNGNASFFDRLYLFIALYSKRSSDFTGLDVDVKTNANKDTVVDTDSLYKTFLGYFYRFQYRKEKQNLQLIYSKSYNTANALSQIMEGNGIRVVDIGRGKSDNEKRCQVVGESDKFSQTARSLSEFFKCQLKKGKTEGYDLVFYLGSLEKEWEIN